MTYLKSILFLFVLGFAPQFANGANPSLIKKLQSYSVKDLELSKENTDKKIGLKILEMAQSLNESSKNYLVENKAPSEELVYQIVRVTLLTFREDPSEGATEIILPLYEKNKEAFEKAINQFPLKEQKKLRESLKNTSRELKEGNG